MQTLAITRTVAYGCPPRQFAVTFRVGDERLVEVASEGRRELFRWNLRGVRYRPDSVKVLEVLIGEFLRREQQPGIDEANAELARVRGRKSEVGVRKEAAVAACQCDAHERQLPVGDRVEV